MRIETPVRTIRHFKTERPEGCVCDPREWSWSEIASVCKHYEPVSATDDRCGWCEHDRECHCD